MAMLVQNHPGCWGPRLELKTSLQVASTCSECLEMCLVHIYISIIYNITIFKYLFELGMIGHNSIYIYYCNPQFVFTYIYTYICMYHYWGCFGQ